ncbi:MAG: hypothetical protein H6621_11155 [Halobacteriovoraceae bacterium]|nr:hypothetical protein [Halobacteriovoraceae bacterium]MCB9095616.1 hypothetical protein [Halobacteriovoraceae bacterium]
MKYLLSLLILFSCSKEIIKPRTEKIIVQQEGSASQRTNEESVEGPGEDSRLEDSGKDVGTGGIGIVCTNSQGEETVDFYDLVKAKEFWNWEPVKISGNSEEEIAIKVLERFQYIDPERFLRYKKDILQFKKEAKFLEGFKLKNTNDFSVEGEFRNCTYQNIVRQLPLHKSSWKDPSIYHSQDYRYLVDNKLYSKLDIFEKASLLVHEVIYKEALELGFESSDNVTYLNAYYHAKAIHEDRQLISVENGLGYSGNKEYFKVLAKINFPYYQSKIPLAVNTETKFDHLFTRVMIGKPYYKNLFEFVLREKRGAWAEMRVSFDLSRNEVKNIYYYYDRKMGLVEMKKKTQALLYDPEGVINSEKIKLPKLIEFNPDGKINQSSGVSAGWLYLESEAMRDDYLSIEKNWNKSPKDDEHWFDYAKKVRRTQNSDVRDHYFDALELVL